MDDRDLGDLPHVTRSMMPAELFRVGDVVCPTFGLLRGVRGVVSRIDKYVEILFPRPVRKYDDARPRDAWCYMPENVRLVAFARVSRVVR